jgi:hypothetical protein
LNETHQILVCADDVNILDENTSTIKEERKRLLYNSKEVVLEVSAGEIKHMFMSLLQNAGQNHNLFVSDNYLENLVKLKYFRTIVSS